MSKTKSRNPFSTSCHNLSSILIENLSAAAAAAPVAKTVKCILVGDAGIGKSSLVRSFISSNGLSPKYAPTAWEDYSVHKRMKDVSENGTGIQQQRFQLAICDTGGQKEMDRLRPLCYNKVNVVIVCFSVINPSSFNNITTKWLPEIKRHAPDAKILLVGTQSDLRSNTQVLLQLSRMGLAPVPESRAIQLMHKIGALSYTECSTLRNKNVKQVFDYTLTWGLQDFQRFGDKNDTAGPCESKKKRHLMSKDWISKTFSKLKKMLFVSYI
jgi:small GTP-binding protein